MTAEPNTIEVEVLPSEVDGAIVKYAAQAGLEKQSTETLVEAFRPIFAKLREALADSRGVAESVKDATCVREIMRSRACRLALRAVRLESDEARKKHKQHALLYGRAVDGFHNILLADLSPVETALQEAEDIAERAEAARLSALKAAREAELAPLLEVPVILGNLADLSEVQWAKTLADAKLLKQAKLDAAAKAEAETKAKIEADRLERERIAAENERLKAEAIAREAVAKAEREATEKKLAEERAAWEKKRKEEQDAAFAKAEIERKRVEAERAEERRKAKAESDAELAKQIEITRKQQAEAKRLKDELAAKAKAEAVETARVEAERAAAAEASKLAAAAPDKAKLQTFADAIRKLQPPELNNQQVLGQVFEQIAEFAAWIEPQIPRL